MSTSKSRRRGSVPASDRGPIPFKALVYAKGLNLRSLAESSGVAERDVQAFSRGSAGRKPERLDAVAKVLGLSRADVLASITAASRVAAERIGV